ncbi:MAG: hypothetical protein K6U74_02015, partial [Firmicutes bacterium]|nr:hypothetical protein [Bacillota bacterium]
ARPALKITFKEVIGAGCREPVSENMGKIIDYVCKHCGTPGCTVDANDNTKVVVCWACGKVFRFLRRSA